MLNTQHSFSPTLLKENYIIEYSPNINSLPKLQNNDKVEIVAPSNIGYQETIYKALTYLQNLGLDPKISNNIYGIDKYYSNTNEYRAKDFKEALESDAKVIWAMKGGKGASQIIPYLNGEIENFTPVNPDLINNKTLIGFSDITALHLYLIKNFELPVIHGPMLGFIVNYASATDSIALLEKILFGKIEQLQYPIKHHRLAEPNNHINDNNLHQFQPLSGKVTGGNLELIRQSIGTDWEIDTTNKFLFIEDINVNGFQLERALEHLIQADILDNAKALIFAHFTDIKSTEMQEVIERFVNRVENEYTDRFDDLSVFSIENVGHNFKNNPMILNTPSTIYEQDGIFNLSMLL